MPRRLAQFENAGPLYRRLATASGTTALALAILAGSGPPRLLAQCLEKPAVWMNESAAESHLLAKRDLALPSKAPRLARVREFLLLVTVDREGSICDVKPISGPEESARVAIETVRKHWRYRRFLLDWKPVIAQFPVRLKVVLPRREPWLEAREVRPGGLTRSSRRHEIS